MLHPFPKLTSANKHKPWIEAEYQGIVMENDNTVLLNPPLFALDKDAPLRYAGRLVPALGRLGAGRDLQGGRGRTAFIPTLDSVQEMIASKPCSREGPWCSLEPIWA